ncbi:MAG: hypothetical protein PHE18_03275 [Candidatus Omnitrophica bacterium]|nr:hypothetical protein [Candidatus Omnitrophota bacterium]MDD5552877.1 hypothetical protein [Candidatus Omnitrophota bacterium]
MNKKGLCSTCVEGSDCVFSNGLSVLQCEEFSSRPAFIQAKAKKVIRVVREEVTESE